MQRSTVNGSLKKSSRRLFLAGVATLGLVGCREHGDLADMMDEADAAADNAVAGDAMTQEAAGNVAEESREHTRKLVQQRLDEAQATIAKQVGPSVIPMRKVFAVAYGGVPEFVDHALGWTSKFKLAWDVLPGTENVRQSRYLREQFERLVLSEANLQQGMKSSVGGFAAEIQSAENTMLVRLQQDLDGFDGNLPVGKLDYQALQRSYQWAVDQSQQTAQVEVAEAVAQMTIAVLVEKMIGRIVARCTTSGVIYSVGALGAPGTFGVTLGLAFVIDFLVGWVWSWFSNPRGDLELQLKQKLDALQREFVGGPDVPGGLWQELSDVAASRAELRQAAVMQWIAG